MQVIRKHFGLYTIFIVVLLCSGITSADTFDPVGLYQDYCSVCHGEFGDGRTHTSAGLHPPPRDFTVPGLALRLTRNAMIDAVRNGRPGTAMVSWQRRLDDAEIGSIVDYIRQHFMLDEPADMHTAMPIAAELQAGASIYERNCSVCHGDQGQGAAWGRESLVPPPRDFSTASAYGSLTRDRMIASVTHGRPGTAMSAWGSRLSTTEINLVVDYIREQWMSPADYNTSMNTRNTDDQVTNYLDDDKSTVDGHTLELFVEAIRREGSNGNAGGNFPDGLLGNIDSGAASYHLNCVQCHGVSGDGNGPRAYFIYPRPRDLRHPAMRNLFDREKLFVAIKNGVIGREMPAWGKVLNDQQIADVGEYVFSTFIHGGDRLVED